MLKPKQDILENSYEDGEKVEELKTLTPSEGDIGKRLDAYIGEATDLSLFFLRCTKKATPANIVIMGMINVTSCEFSNKLKAAPRFWTYVKSNTPRKTGSVSPTSMRLLTANLVI